jgi:hypothetical protein
MSASAERPSPFTVPEPTVRYIEEGAEEAPSCQPKSMTVRELILKLTDFAVTWEEADAAIDRAASLQQPYTHGQRDANPAGISQQFLETLAPHLHRRFFFSNLAFSKQQEILAAVAIDRVRDYVLAKHGGELTIGTARRLLGDLIRERGLTAEAAEELSLATAMDLLQPVSNDHPTPNDVDKASGQADSQSDNRLRIPENPDVLALARRINRERPSGKSKTSIAREFTEGNETKAQTLLRELRRFPHLLD